MYTDRKVSLGKEGPYCAAPLDTGVKDMRKDTCRTCHLIFLKVLGPFNVVHFLHAIRQNKGQCFTVVSLYVLVNIPQSLDDRDLS